MSMATLAPSSRRTDVEKIRVALRRAWSRETSIDGDAWGAGNPAWGQCAVTALVVQDFLGGSIRRGLVPSGSHYWNQLPSGREIDLTRHQFPTGFVPKSVEDRDRSYLLSDERTRRRYALLREAVDDALRAGAR